MSAPDPALSSKSAEVEKTLGIGVYKKKRSYVWPVVIALHALHVPVQAVSQQNPSTQKPLRQFAAAEQG